MADGKQVIKDAVREVMNERAVNYANGAVRFANTVTESWASLIDAADNFFLQNFVEDQPDASGPALDARLAAATKARNLLDEKIKKLQKMKQRRVVRKKK